jgi:hypothetical protein
MHQKMYRDINGMAYMSIEDKLVTGKYLKPYYSHMCQLKGTLAENMWIYFMIN